MIYGHMIISEVERGVGQMIWTMGSQHESWLQFTFKGNTRHSEATWPIQRWHDSLPQYVFTCKLWKCWAALYVHICAGRRETLCMKVLCSSGKPVFASVYANSCSAGWWEALRVELGKHCERCDQAFPVLVWRVWSSQRLADGASLLSVAGYCVCRCDYTLCDRERQTRSTRSMSQARCSTIEDHRSVLARKKKWCEPLP